LTIKQDLVEPQALRQTMRLWTTGVTVLSSHYHGHQHGMTVNSFTAISLEPPIILVSLNRESRTYEIVAQSGVFGVTILSDQQQEISERFAGRIPDEADRFQGLETFTLFSGSPFLEGGLAFIDCRVTQSVDFGGNTLFLGEVLGIGNTFDGKPLVYHKQGYHFLKDD
jgi:flavin reductase (DIM6/NTAB) family NADH-FMN oxidoreductase RutF